MTFSEIVKRIAETYREDGEELNCDNCNDIFKIYGYDSDDLKEEFYFALCNDFTKEEKGTFYFTDNCEICETVDNCEIWHTFRELARFVREYIF